jgi:hypothetical protein
MNQNPESNKKGDSTTPALDFFTTNLSKEAEE